MNWIEIDRILYKMIEQHSTPEAVYTEACKTFKWDLKQARDAVDPLLKRHTFLLNAAKSANITSKQLRND
jgi:hypothetical protein